jgi:hypothetical protein
MPRPEIVADFGDLNGEAPVWDADTGTLYWTDCVGFKFCRFQSQTGKSGVLRDICHWRQDYHPDHSISSMIVDECVIMTGIPNIKTASPPFAGNPHVYFMDTPAGVGFEPEIYVDTTETFATKVKMVAQHVSQNSWMKKMFGYELEAFLEIPAKFRGLQAGCKNGGGVSSELSLGQNIP